MVYYASRDGLTVNLYTQSSATVALGDGSSDDPTVRISQATDYPNSGKVVVELTPSEPARFPLSLRIPRWCTSADVSVNGKPARGKVSPGTFFTIKRKWKPGDTVELDMPMAFRLVKGREANLMKVAVMRGPVLFCLNPSLNEQFSAIKTDGSVPGRLIGLNPSTLRGPVPDDTVRPNGMAAKVSMWVVNNESQVTSVDLLLTEFPDPDGQMTYLPMQGMYFRGDFFGDGKVEHIDLLVEDELRDP